MRILFASAHPYLPQLAGGTQSNTHEWVAKLEAVGHQVAVLAGLSGEGWLGLRGRLVMKATGCRVVSDRTMGYPVYRAWFAWEGAIGAANRFSPDVAIVQSGSILRVATALRGAGVPVVVYNHNVEFDDHGADMAPFRDAQFIANSNFTASAYRDRYGIESTVIVPFFDADRYRANCIGEEVLFINPHPQKGADIAVALAEACPDIPFRFVRGWKLEPAQEQFVSKAAARLANVSLLPSTRDMLPHYAAARVLLVPSRWAETWGRVATEAQFSGIPVLASDRGGLPEAVGPGGVLLSPDAPIGAWISALRRMWDDRAHHAALASAALAHSRRAQINPDRQVAALEAVLKRAM